MKRLIFAGVILAVLAGILLAMPTLTHAQGGDKYPPNVDPDEVYKIARKMYCDVCAGVPLADCPSPQCQAWREEIADYLSQGMTEAEIREIFAERYGDKISGVPVGEGNRRFAYAIPLILTLLAALGIVWQVNRWQNRQSTQAAGQAVAQSAGLRAEFDRPVPDNVDPAYLERFLALLEDTKA